MSDFGLSVRDLECHFSQQCKPAIIRFSGKWAGRFYEGTNLADGRDRVRTTVGCSGRATGQLFVEAEGVRVSALLSRR